MTDSSPAEDVRDAPMGFIWVVAVLLAGLAVGVFKPVEALEDAIVNKGLSEEQIEAGAFIAGFTLPLFAATAIVLIALLNGWFSGVDVRWRVLIIAGIFWFAGDLSQELGLGLAPAQVYEQVHGHPLFAIPANVFLSYFTAYGFPLMFAGVILGVAAGLQVTKWAQQASTPSGD